MHNLSNTLLGVLFIAITCSIVACDNSLDVNAPYKETTIVYGVLNHTDSTHFVRVNRAFLSTDNALLYTSTNDSFYHQYPIKVLLKEFQESSLLRTIQLDTVHVKIDSGFFSTDNFFVYKYQGRINPFNHYEIEVRNAVNDTIICSGIAPIVDDFILRGFPNIINFYDGGTFPATNTKLLPPNDGFRLDFGYYFYYSVVDEATQTKVRDSIYILCIQGGKLPGIRSNVEYTYPIIGQNFYNTLQLRLDPLPTGFHREYEIVLRGEYAIAGKDLTTYIDINGPSISLSDVKPRYTNINNGLGLFSSRYFKYFLMTMSTQSEQYLTTGPITGNLGFKN